MPLVFATGAPTVTPLIYEDVFGVQYEFPDRYRAYIVEGERFLYYRGKRGAEGTEGAAYLGRGIVGPVRESANVGRWVADILDFAPFPAPVSLRTKDGPYFETGSTKGTNWANGVRRIDDSVFERIIEAAPKNDYDEIVTDVRSHNLASPEHATRLERYSMKIALAILRDEYGADLVHEMPPGNPGFDIEVSTTPPLHVEVKGTVLAEPVFHLSEGQRQHALMLGPQFRLLIVHNVDLARQKHLVSQISGPISFEKAHLKPAAWSGKLLSGPIEHNS